MSHPLKAPVDWNPIPALAGCILDVIIGVIPFDHRWWQTPRMSHGQKRAAHARLGCLHKDYMSWLRVHNIVEYARACDVLNDLYCPDVQHALDSSLDLPAYWSKGNLPKRRLAEVDIIVTVYNLMARVLPVPQVADMHRSRPNGHTCPCGLPVHPFLELWSVHRPNCNKEHPGGHLQAPYLTGGGGSYRGGWKALLDEVLYHKFVCRNNVPWNQCREPHSPPSNESMSTMLSDNNMREHFERPDLQFMLFLAQFTTSSTNQHLDTASASSSGRCRWAVRKDTEALHLLNAFLRGECQNNPPPSDVRVYHALMAVQTQLHKVQAQYGLQTSVLHNWAPASGMSSAFEAPAPQPLNAPLHIVQRHVWGDSSFGSPEICGTAPPAACYHADGQHGLAQTFASPATVVSSTSTVTANTMTDYGTMPDRSGCSQDGANSLESPVHSPQIAFLHREQARLVALAQELNRREQAIQELWQQQQAVDAQRQELLQRRQAVVPPSDDASKVPDQQPSIDARQEQQAVASDDAADDAGFRQCVAAFRETLDQPPSGRTSPSAGSSSPQQMPGPSVGSANRRPPDPQVRPEPAPAGTVEVCWTRARPLHSSAAPGQSCMAVHPSGSTLGPEVDHFGWYGVLARENHLAKQLGHETFGKAVRDAVDSRTSARRQRGCGSEWKQINGELDREAGARRMVPLDKCKAGIFKTLRNEWARLADELSPMFAGQEMKPCCEVLISKSQCPPTGRQEWHIDICPNDGPRALWGVSPVDMQAVVVFTPIGPHPCWDLDILPGSHNARMQEQAGGVMAVEASEDNVMTVTVGPLDHLVMLPTMVHRGTPYPDKLPDGHPGGNLYVAHCIIAPTNLAAHFSKHKPNGVRNGLVLDGTRLTPHKPPPPQQGMPRGPDPPRPDVEEHRFGAQRSLDTAMDAAARFSTMQRSPPPCGEPTHVQPRPAAYLGCAVQITFTDQSDSSMTRTYDGVVEEYDRHKKLFRIHFPDDPDDDQHWVAEPTVREKLDYTKVKCDICRRTCTEHPGCKPPECKAQFKRKRGGGMALQPCKDGRKGEHLLMCDTCPAVRHLTCDVPPRTLTNEAQMARWNCPKCLEKSNVN